LNNRFTNRKSDILQDFSFMVKYCGGCNSRYDRAGAIKRIQERIPIKIKHYDGRTIPDLLLIVKGCWSECINKDEYKSKYGIFCLQDEKDLEDLLEEIINKLK